MLPYRDSRAMRIALGIFFILLLGYAYYEAQGLLFGPRINLYTPSPITVTEEFVTIQGQADRISALFMNGAQISVTKEGGFEESLLLTPGRNIIYLTAVDSSGRKQEKTLELVYVPENKPEIPAATTTSSGTTTNSIEITN